MNVGRVIAMVQRHYYLYRASWTRVIELMYWPIMELLVWGFLTLYLRQLGPDLPDFLVLFLGALILWDVLFRAQIGVSLAFLEEMWSRNLANLFVSPLTPLEFMAGQLIVGVVRTTVSVGVMVILAGLFFHFNLFDMGFALAAFFTNLLIMGWSIGLVVSALILRFGQGAESLAWAVIFLFQPVAAVFYPVSVLPAWLQTFAWATPAAHVFEGMRVVLLEHRFDMALFTDAVGLNALYLASAVAFFLWAFRVARRRGLLMQVGE
jgi:ABC-2 type transport system permease protein